MSRRLLPLVLLARAKDLPAYPHAAQVVDRLAEDREPGRGDPMRAVHEPLRFTDAELVVDPAVRGIEPVRVGIVGRDDHVGRTLDGGEVLHPPRVVLDDGHPTAPLNVSARNRADLNADGPALAAAFERPPCTAPGIASGTAPTATAPPPLYGPVQSRRKTSSSRGPRGGTSLALRGVEPRVCCSRKTARAPCAEPCCKRGLLRCCFSACSSSPPPHRRPGTDGARSMSPGSSSQHRPRTIAPPRPRCPLGGASRSASGLARARRRRCWSC